MKYIALIACLLAGCGQIVDAKTLDAGGDSGTNNDADSNTDTDSNADTDIDSDADTDTNGDNDSDTDTSDDTDTNGDTDTDTNTDTNTDTDTNACEDVICDDPPTNECIPLGQLKEYTGNGVCVEGECHYTHNLIECEHGCTIEVIEADHCADPCDNIICDDPPPSECKAWYPIEEYYILFVTYKPEGTCSEGVCSYPKDANLCPDDNACIPDPEPYCMTLKKPAGWMDECQEEAHCSPSGASYCLQADENQFGTCTTTGCETGLDCYQGAWCCDCKDTGKFDNLAVCTHPSDLDIMQFYCNCD